MKLPYFKHLYYLSGIDWIISGIDSFMQRTSPAGNHSTLIIELKTQCDKLLLEEKLAELVTEIPLLNVLDIEIETGGLLDIQPQCLGELLHMCLNSRECVVGTRSAWGDHQPYGRGFGRNHHRGEKCRRQGQAAGRQDQCKQLAEFI